MDFLSLISQNILSPAILFFALGLIAGLLKSDLEVPDSISRYLSLYLMMAIGFKGGVAIANTASFNGEILLAIGAGLIFGFLQPFLGYGLQADDEDRQSHRSRRCRALWFNQHCHFCDRSRISEHE